MPLLMSDVAAGSNAALQLQQNMAAMPDVQQAQNIAMQQQQANLERTKLANIVAETGIKTDQNAVTAMQKLVQTDKWKTADAANDDATKLRLQGNVLMSVGKYDAGEKALASADASDLKQQQVEAKKLDNYRQQVLQMSSIVEDLPDDKVDSTIRNLPPENLKAITDKVGATNWNNFTPKEKKAVLRNLAESANNKLQEQKILANIEIAKKRAEIELLKIQERNRHSEATRSLNQDANIKLWGSVNQAIDRVQRDPATVAERKRLDEAVDKAETEALKATTFGSLSTYKPEGSEQSYYSKAAYDKYMQAVRRRDKHIAVQLDEEEALVKTLPKEAGNLRESQLKKIEQQRLTLQLDEPGKKEIKPYEIKQDAPPAAPAAAKPSAKPVVPSNKYTQDNPARPTSKQEYDKLPPGSYYIQDGVTKIKGG